PWRVFGRARSIGAAPLSTRNPWRSSAPRSPSRCPSGTIRSGRAPRAATRSPTASIGTERPTRSATTRSARTYWRPASNNGLGPGGMITYLWVALGGALGSVARFWFGALVAALLGPQFPWGTIFINIIGSFIIGFFATFT